MSYVSGIFLIVRRSLRQHILSTFVTVLSVALACGLLMAVFNIKTQAYEAFTGGSRGYDAVLGARGSQLQLVLNTVFHLETSPGNIPWKLYKTMANDPRVKLAVPYAVGDNYHGFRIVGTTEDIFTKYQYQPGRQFQLRSGGRFFSPDKREAVVGSFVARTLGLKVGDIFNSYHGVAYDENMKHPEQFQVVGILKPTSTPSDRVIWIPIEAVYRMTGHVLRGTGKEYIPKENEAIPDESKEVSAVMIKFKNPQAGFILDQTINRQGNVATLAWPIAKVMADLFNKIGWMNRVLALVAYLIIVVAASSILASVYNTMNERRREFAILRALGARRRIVFSAIVIEAASIAALGTFLGYFIYALLLGVASLIVRIQTGVVLEVLRFHEVFILTPIGMTLLGALAGVVPAFKAYSTDVATNLVPT